MDFVLARNMTCGGDGEQHGGHHMWEQLEEHLAYEIKSRIQVGENWELVGTTKGT
jgi:hypothetical protein